MVKDKAILLRVTKDEKRAVSDAAKRSGQTVSAYLLGMHDAAQKKLLREVLGDRGGVSPEESLGRAQRLTQLGILWSEQGKIQPRLLSTGALGFDGSDLLFYATGDRGTKEDLDTLRGILDPSIPFEPRGMTDEQIAERGERYVALVRTWIDEGKIARRARPGGPVDADDLSAFLSTASLADRRALNRIIEPVKHNPADTKAFAEYLETAGYAEQPPSKEKSSVKRSRDSGNR